MDKVLHKMAFSLSDILYIILISLVQGITEFLPVSSSGHLILLPEFTGQTDYGLSIDVAAHVGTLIAVLIYVRFEIKKMCLAVKNIIQKTLCPHVNVVVDKQSITMLKLMFVASVPVVIAGFFISFYEPSFIRMVQTVAISNLVFAGFLWHSDKTQEHKRDLSKMKLKEALFVGLAQMLAVIPGTSRSGVTITMARYLSYDRTSAARFSLLLSIPVIFAAGFLQAVKLLKGENALEAGIALIVLFVSCVIALLVVHAMMAWIRRKNFGLFVVYRLILGIFLLVISF